MWMIIVFWSYFYGFLIADSQEVVKAQPPKLSKLQQHYILYLKLYIINRLLVLPF